MAKQKKQYLKLKDRKQIRKGLDKVTNGLPNYNSIAWIELNRRFRGDAVKHEVETYSIDGHYDPFEANKLAKQVRRGTRKDKYKTETDPEFIIRLQSLENAMTQVVTNQWTPQPLTFKQFLKSFGVQPEVEHNRGLFLGGQSYKKMKENMEQFIGMSLSLNTMRKQFIPLNVDLKQIVKKGHRATIDSVLADCIVHLTHSDRGTWGRLTHSEHGTWSGLASYLCLLKFVGQWKKLSSFDIYATERFFKKHSSTFVARLGKNTFWPWDNMIYW